MTDWYGYDTPRWARGIPFPQTTKPCPRCGGELHQYLNDKGVHIVICYKKLDHIKQKFCGWSQSREILITKKAPVKPQADALIEEKTEAKIGFAKPDKARKRPVIKR